MSTTINLAGRRIGNLSVVRITGRNPVRWLCQCDCGNSTVALSSNLLHEHTKSCGCLRAKTASSLFTKHGHCSGGEETPEFKAWKKMKDRCYQKSNPGYLRYGGRGITVCERWIHSFEAFLQDMGERPPGKSLDRIDNNLGYSPENCRWATRLEQSNNTSKSRFIVSGGIKKTVAEWAREKGIRPQVIYYRLYAGWSESRAINPRATRSDQLELLTA